MNLGEISKTLKHGDAWVKTDEKGFRRSVHSKALLNTDNHALAEYKRAREIRRDNKKEIEQYSKDINNLKNEVTEIKDSLKQILDAINSKG
jgi:chromosome segregation ATPase